MSSSPSSPPSSPSRRRPRSERRQRHQRAVSFASRNKVLFDTSYPFLDSAPFEDRWYTDADFTALRAEAKELSRRVRSFQRGKCKAPPPTSEDDPAYCVRGMDYMISQSEFSRRKSRKEASTMSVLIEQDRRRRLAEDEGSDANTDASEWEEALASVSRTSSEATVKEARAMALQDELAARRIQSEEKQRKADADAERRRLHSSQHKHIVRNRPEQFDSFRSVSTSTERSGGSSSRGFFRIIQRATDAVSVSSSADSPSSRSSVGSSDSGYSSSSLSSGSSSSTNPARPERRRQRRSRPAGAKNAFFKGMAQAWGAPVAPPQG